jgi:hypothetical protein
VEFIYDNEFLANAVAVIHLLWVFYTVLVFLWTLAAFFIHRQFLNWFWFRTIHLVDVILIVLLPRFGMACPLSTAEIYLRLHTDSAFMEGFLLHYLRKFLHEGIGPAFIEVSTLVMFLGTLAAYLYRPPKRAERWFEGVFPNRRKPRAEQLSP